MTSRDEAIEQLLATRGRALTGYAYLLCGDVHEAEDLVQDALVKTFARRRAGVELVSAEAYLRRAICTLYVDRWRSRARWAGRLPVAAAPEATDSAETAVADRTDVMRALATLPPQQRAAVVLRYYEDLTVPEVAARMGLGDGTVKRYLSLATHRLEDLLGTLAATRPRRDRPGGVMFDLTRALTDAADAADREPPAAAPVIARVRRRVALRRTGDAVLGLAAAGALVLAVQHLDATPLPPVGPTPTAPTPTAPSPTGSGSAHNASWLGCGADTSGLAPVTVDGLVLTGSIVPYGPDGEPRLGATLDNGGAGAVLRAGSDRLRWVAVQDGRVVADAGATLTVDPHTLDAGSADYLSLDESLSLSECRTGDPVTGPYDVWLRADLGATGDGAAGNGAADPSALTLVSEPLWTTDDPAPVPPPIPLVGAGRQPGSGDRVVLERQTGPASWDVVVSVGGAVPDAYPSIRDALLAAGFTAVSEKTDRQRSAWSSGRFTGHGYTVSVDVSNETGGDTFAEWTVVGDGPGSGPGAETGWVAVTPPPPSALETTLVDVATQAGVADAGPAEHNFGLTATVWGTWGDKEALLWVAEPPLGSVWADRDAVDLGGVPGTTAEDSSGNLGVVFTCGDLTYSVQVLDPAASGTADLPAAVELATAMARSAC